MSRVFPPRAAKLRSKGRQERSFGCAAGRVVLRRRYFQTRDGESGGCLVDDALGIAARMLSVGMRQLICQAGTESRSFGRGAGLLKSQAGLSVGKEQMRQVVHAEARLVQQMSAKEQLDPGWKASEALTTTPQGQRVSRVMVAADGVMVPTTTQASKDKRRKTVVARRREMPADRRVELKPLEPVRKGSDNGYKVAYLTRFYDQDKSHTLVGSQTRGCPACGGCCVGRAAGFCCEGLRSVWGWWTEQSVWGTAWNSCL